MLFPTRTCEALAAGLGLTLLILTTLPQAADKAEIHSFFLQGADLYADRAEAELMGSEITNNSGEGISPVNTMRFRPSFGQERNELEFGAKLIFDSYVIFVSQSF